MTFKDKVTPNSETKNSSILLPLKAKEQQKPVVEKMQKPPMDNSMKKTFNIKKRDSTKTLIKKGMLSSIT